jgi:hypothetical protein
MDSDHDKSLGWALGLFGVDPHLIAVTPWLAKL